LSGFAFPFRGMPLWAQWLGEALPITHFLRVIRGVMLKGAGFLDLAGDFFALLVITLALASVAMLRYRRTLD
jgi:ABC-2 type transport system permease protein